MITNLPTIAEAQQQIRDGKLTPLDLVEYCLRQIGLHEKQLLAWVLVDADGARQQAEELQNNSDSPGPLHGIPIAIKDIVDVAGMPTKAGSPTRENHVAEKDAPLVARLRRAGAIILGKTVTTEFAGFDPPPTRNPWNLNHTPGGSSSGSAAAVAMEMCMASIGSQTGGSITRPAAYCGVTGLKPTFGVVSVDGVVPVSFHLDHPGPMARNVHDLATVFFALTEPESSEKTTQDSVYELFDKICAGQETPKPYLAVLDEFFMQQADEPVRSSVTASIEKLREAGAVIGEASLPESFQQLHKMHRRIMAVDAAMVHREAYQKQKSDFGPNFASLLEEGLATSATDYSAALLHQQQFQRDALGFFTQGNALLAPATNFTAPDLKTTGDPKFNSPWSYAGLPVVNIPCGLADNGMPIALQLIGPPHSEAILLYAAAWCEKRLQFDARPPCLNSQD